MSVWAIAFIELGLRLPSLSYDGCDGDKKPVSQSQIFLATPQVSPDLLDSLPGVWSGNFKSC